MEPFGHGAIRFPHLGDLREHGAFPIPLASLHLLDAIPYRASFLLRESLGLLADRSDALDGLLRALLCRFHEILFFLQSLNTFQQFISCRNIMSGTESDLQKRLKGIQWQSQNCLSCIWFATTDPLNADLFDRAICIHPKLKIYQLVVSGRDWCNLYEEIKQKQIEHKQERALKAEQKSG
jgi:hypothetical protein